VRIEALGNPNRHVGEAASQSDTWVVILGYRDHPTEADTDILPTDRFTHDDTLYSVHSVKPLVPYQLHAFAMAVQ
jgi:hypothetical protein